VARPIALDAPAVVKYPQQVGPIPAAMMKDIVKTTVQFVSVSEATYEQRQEETVARLEQFLKGSL
jgi:hypothetical protein